jgi:glucokinase
MPKAETPRKSSEGTETEGILIPPSTARNILLGVDIGGTKVAAGLVDSCGKILVATHTPMVARGTPQQGLEPVFSSIDALLTDRRSRRVRSIGVSVPGWVDTERGMLLGAANLPCWRDFPLAQTIRRRFRFPVRIGNDANLAALAEATWGAGRDSSIVLYVTVGTGVGTGIVIDGHIYSGRFGGASEGGHLSINFRGPRCGCGKRGCAETYFSGTAIARRARQLVAAHGGRKSRIVELAGGKITSVTAETVAKAASGGDALAARILDEAAGSFAIWLGSMIDLLEPGVIVIGGGMARLMTSLRGRLRRRLKVWSANPRHDEIPIVAAHYGAESALVGAAALGLADRK